MLLREEEAIEDRGGKALSVGGARERR